MMYSSRSIVVFFAFVLSLAPSLLGSSIPRDVMGLEMRDDDLPARVPYIFPAPGTDALADSFRARREGGVLLDLDGVLLQSRLFAAGWSQMFGAIRDNNTLPGTMRELFILRTAVLNHAAYQWMQHESVGRAEGLTTEQLLAIRLSPPFIPPSALAPILGKELAAAAAFADELALSVRVSDATFNNLAAFLNTTQLVDATATAGGYAFVSRFTVGLNLDDKMDVSVPIPK